MSLSVKDKLIPIAKGVCRELRSNATPAEQLFWEEVRDRKFLNLKFYRQHPLFVDINGRETFFVADFYCHEKKLIIEIDGRIHDFQTNDDVLREQIIRDKSIRVLRFRNEEVEKDIFGVLDRVGKYLCNSNGNNIARSTPSLFKRRGRG